MPLDQYYTPEVLSDRLASYCVTVPRRIADFCAGEGRLLHSCEKLFPGAEYLAVDKSKRAISKLLLSHPFWEIHHADFLSDRQLDRIALRENTFDLVMFNPPFSCRGGRYSFKLDDLEFSASKAMLFLARALRFIARGGMLLGILPVGVVHALRDHRIVSYLKAVYNFKVLEHVSDISFKGKSPNVILIAIQKPKVRQEYHEHCVRFLVPSYLQRGCCNVIMAKGLSSKSGLQYVHTTDLQSGALLKPHIRLPSSCCRVLHGPAVLLPRVGTPSPSKIVVIGSSKRIILSDCVIGVLAKNEKAAIKIKDRLKRSFHELSQLYRGTGARYVTLYQLGVFLDRRLSKGLIRA